jgi:hypothetical protein
MTEWRRMHHPILFREQEGNNRPGVRFASRAGWSNLAPICNLYAATKGQQAIRELTRAMFDRTGNLPPLPGIFPDYAAPIVRNTADGRELAMARWGMPSPVFALKGRNSDPGVTNVRNTAPHTGADRLARLIAAWCRLPASRRTK